jgi:hypothetical protein
MTSEIRPQPGIMDIALYEGGAATVAGKSNTIKLSSNENPFGPSDKAKEAFSRVRYIPCTATPTPITPLCAKRLPRFTSLIQAG